MTTQKARAAVLALALLAAAAAAACIESEKKATMTLAPDGSVRWSVLQRDVRSTDDSAETRAREEQEFLAKVRASQHDEAIAFRLLGGLDVTTRILSDDWPFSVQTEARFADFGDVWLRYFQLQGARAQSGYTRAGDRVTWTLVVNVAELEQEDRQADQAESEASRALQSLFADAGPTVFIQGGRFVEAKGFTLQDNGRVAKPDDFCGRDWEKEPVLTLSLTWTASAETVTRPR
jgi:hypothetical protein